MTGKGLRRGAAVCAAAAVISAAAILMPTPNAVHAADDCAPGNPQYTTMVPAALATLGAERAWTRATGAGVLVAVVDSGIDAANAHLAGTVVDGINLVPDGEHPQGFSDPSGHGTAIAGQIAAREVPGSGVVGLAPDATLLSVRVFRGTDDESVRSGFGPSNQRLAEGIRYAASAGATIINVSLSDFADAPELRSAVDFAESHGSLVVASAGNRATASDTSDGVRYPAAYDGALAVTAVDPRGLPTTDSIHGPHVEVAAPGANILTTATGAGDCLYAENAPSSSFATGYASAAAALVAQAHAGETPAQWKYRLMATGTRSHPDQRDDRNGWGMLQPYDAINLLPGPDVRGPASADFPAAEPITPASTTVVPNYSSSPFETTQQAAVVVALAAGTVLGTIAVVIVLLKRRRQVPEAATRSQTGGLFKA
jgi:hypothetical protein